MKYINFNLSDKTPVKFKIRRLKPYGLDIEWKYTDRFNFPKYIDLDISRCYMECKIDYYQQLSDKELINEHKKLIEEHHCKIKSIKRRI